MIGLGILIFKKTQIEVHKINPWQLVLALPKPECSPAEQEHLIASIRSSGEKWTPDAIFTEEEFRNFIDKPKERGELACDALLVVEFPTTDCWLVRRHGINLANQNFAIKPVAIILHKHKADAEKIAYEKVPTASGQFLELVPASQAEFKEWMEIVQQDKQQPNTVVHE